MDTIDAHAEYVVERPILFFCRTQIVMGSKILEYFTKKAADDLVECKYLIKTNRNK